MESFYSWQTPFELKQAVEAARGLLGRKAVKRPGREFREGFVAARFAAFRDAECVKLLKTRQGKATPDFALKIGNTESWFETTEADRPGRKRGDENWKEAATHESFDDSEWVSPEAYFEVVNERTAQKAQKQYDKCEGLIVWSNAFPIESVEQLTQEWWRSATSSASGVFAEIWVYYRSEFLRMY